jgi:hypothetical protein
MFEVVTCFLVVLIESFHYLIHMIRIRLFLLPELERNIIRWIKNRMEGIHEDECCFIHENTCVI